MPDQVKPVTRAAQTRTRNQSLIIDAAESVFARHGYTGGSLKMIAEAANLPKANVVYYFGSKENLYQALLTRIVKIWELGLGDISSDSDPAVVLEQYIRKKVSQSRRYPLASKIFTSEIIQGAPHLDEIFWKELKHWLNNQVAIIQSWIDLEKMNSVDPKHLLFMIWSSTQHYADYSTQLGHLMPSENDELVFDDAANTLCNIILGGCGLKSANLSVH